MITFDRISEYFNNLGLSQNLNQLNMIIKLTLALLFTIVTTFSHSQNSIKLEGLWLKVNSKEKGIIFNKDSTFNMYPLETLNIKVNYTVISEDTINYILFTYIKNEKVILTKQSKFKIENGKLYLPIDVTNKLTGEKRIDDYKDIYIRKKRIY